MAQLKPWFHVIPPREDLREGRPLDASEFAVHLDQVREGHAPVDYQNPQRFFERTYLTKNLTDLASQVLRRLCGVKIETSAVFNMSTQFGGGKTHALTLLYHLASAGPSANEWAGMPKILRQADVPGIPTSATAVFVGTEFDSMVGRGGANGEPLRLTPWGEIAWQLGGAEAFEAIKQHDEGGVAPGGDVIRRFLPDGPALILMDEVMNYISRSRKSGLTAQFYSFLQNLSEEARGRDNLVLAVSIPASELEMNPEDQRDFEAMKKLLDRLGKAVIMSAETESAEIIRRRLFEWHGLPEDGRRVANAYAEWVQEHRDLLGDFDVNAARDRFQACYPFHPALLSVFEHKWQSLPRFQKTRGVLRLLALWVSRAYIEGYKGVHKDPLIGLGTAPLEDPYFRAALFEQLGNSDLEVAVTTDIAGKKDAHAVRLDRDANDEIKKARLHQKVATSVLFESNGGQTRAEATVPEIRLAVAEPALDVANVEMALDALAESCYYLSVDRTRYRFSLSPNLNKLLIDRRASVQPQAIEERVQQEIQAVFKAGPSTFDRVYFPETSNKLPDHRPTLTLAILGLDHPHADPTTEHLIMEMIRNYGTSGRTFKSALFFAVPDGATPLPDEARKLLAAQDIFDDPETVKRLDDSQQRQLRGAIDKAARDLKEGVWRTYKYVRFLAKDGTLATVEFTQPNSSMAGSLVELITNRLRQDDEITDGVGAHRLVRYWPAGLTAWSTKAARDAFYSAPALPRLLEPAILKRTIADGVAQGVLAYAMTTGDGRFDPLYFMTAIPPAEIEYADDVILIRAQDVAALIEPPHLTRIELNRPSAQLSPGAETTFSATGYDQHGKVLSDLTVAWTATGGLIDEAGHYVAGNVRGDFAVRATSGDVDAAAAVRIEALTGSDDVPQPPEPPPALKGLQWHGTVPPQKWMTFYSKVLTRLVTLPGLTLEVSVQLAPDGTVSDALREETRTALRELGLNEDIRP